MKTIAALTQATTDELTIAADGVNVAVDLSATSGGIITRRMTRAQFLLPVVSSLADKVSTSDLTAALAGKQDQISDSATLPWADGGTLFSALSAMLQGKQDTIVDASSLPYFGGVLESAFAAKQDTITDAAALPYDGSTLGSALGNFVNAQDLTNQITEAVAGKLGSSDNGYNLTWNENGTIGDTLTTLRDSLGNKLEVNGGDAGNVLVNGNPLATTIQELYNLLDGKLSVGEDVSALMVDGTTLSNFMSGVNMALGGKVDTTGDSGSTSVYGETLNEIVTDLRSRLSALEGA